MGRKKKKKKKKKKEEKKNSRIGAEGESVSSPLPQVEYQHEESWVHNFPISLVRKNTKQEDVQVLRAQVLRTNSFKFFFAQRKQLRHDTSSSWKKKKKKEGKKSLSLNNGLFPSLPPPHEALSLRTHKHTGF